MSLYSKSILFLGCFIAVLGVIHLLRYLFFRQSPWREIKFSIDRKLWRFYLPLVASRQDLRDLVNQNSYRLIEQTYLHLLNSESRPFVSGSHPLRRDVFFFAVLDGLLQLVACVLLFLGVLSLLIAIYRF